MEIEELKTICDTVVRLTELRQKECSHLCVENFAPECLGKLLQELKTEQTKSWQDQPTEDGYWWFDNIAGELLIVDVENTYLDKAIIFYTGDDNYINLSDVFGKWYGPITPPRED